MIFMSNSRILRIEFFVVLLLLLFSPVLEALNAVEDGGGTLPPKESPECGNICLKKRIGHIHKANPTTYLAFDFSLGGALLKNEYLSPLRYGGKAFGLNLTAESPIVSNKFLMIRSASEINYLQALNPAGNAMLLRFHMRAQSELHYIFRLPHDIVLSSGGGLRFAGGSNKLPSNTNNMADGELKIDLLGSVQLAYRIPCKKFPGILRLYGNLGILGVAHQVGYNQSYYEVLLGKNGVARSFHFTHWGNALQGELVFAFDMPIANFCTLRAGYRLTGDKLHLENRLRTSTYHSAFIGFSFETNWLTGREAQMGKGNRPVLFRR